MPQKDDKLIYGKKGAPAPSYAGGQTSWITRLMLLLIVLTIGAMAFWGLKLQSDLQASRAILADYDNVIAQLRKELSVTDESINQSSAMADDRLKELDGEIRKLWDNVWKKSRIRLDQNEATISSLKNQQASFLKTINEQTELLATIDTNLAAITERFPTVERDATEAKKATGSLVSSIEALRADLQALRSKQLGISAQTKEFNEWIESINGYRKLVNRRLDELETEINNSKVVPATTP